MNRWNHEYSRQEAVELFVRNKDKMDEFLRQREAYLGRLGAGKQRAAKLGKRALATEVHKRKHYREDLKPPPDQFLPLKDYLTRYGHVQKKAGHKTRTLHGIKGVVIPGAESGWATVSASALPFACIFILSKTFSQCLLPIEARVKSF